jgi:hypothetical protein
MRLAREASAGIPAFRAWLFDGVAKIPRLTMNMSPAITTAYRKKWLFGMRTLSNPPAGINSKCNRTAIPLVRILALANIQTTPTYQIPF